MANPEAIERRRERDRIKNRQRRAAKRAAKRQAVQLSWRDGHISKMLKRKLLPRLPDMTKSELRAMLAAAVRNTAQ